MRVPVLALCLLAIGCALESRPKTRPPRASAKVPPEGGQSGSGAVETGGGGGGSGGFEEPGGRSGGGGASGSGGAVADAGVVTVDAPMFPITAGGTGGGGSGGVDARIDTAAAGGTGGTRDASVDAPRGGSGGTIDARRDTITTGGTGGSLDAGRDAGRDASGGSGGASGTGCDSPNLVWKTANKTWFTSYPAPGSEECITYNGCMWAGQFSACSGMKSESWVAAHNIVALFPNFNTYKLHDLCLKSGTKTIVVTVYDTCADSDCSGCCTENKGTADALIDLESYTNKRWGVADGRIQWADLGPTKGSGCN